jgi:hypothetical protein
VWSPIWAREGEEVTGVALSTVASVNQRDSSVMGLPGGCGGRWLGC